MAVYIPLFIFTIFFAYLYTNTKSKKKLRIGKIQIDITPSRIVLFSLMTIPPIIVAGLRYGISVDYFKVYRRGFQEIINRGSSEGFEIGFSFVASLFAKIVPSPEFLFFVFSTIILLLYFESFKESDSYYISVILLFGTGAYFDSFNGIRQYVVVAIFMYAYKYIKSQQFIPYLIIMGLSSLIHTSALITIPIYFLSKINFNIKKLSVVLVAIFLTRGYLYTGVLNIMKLFPKYNLYILRNTLEKQISFSTSGLVMTLIALIPCLFVSDKMQSKAEGKFLYNMVMLGLVVAVCSSFLPMAERILYYTRSYFIFTIPYACSIIKGKKKK